MSNLYQLTAKNHELLPKINQKYGLEIEIESEYVIKSSGEICHNAEFIMGGIEKDMLPRIYEPQIRQILIVLQEVLGVNFKYVEFNKKGNHPFESEKEMLDLALTCGLLQQPKTQAEALCQKWCYGFPTSLFDREPETVLTELNNILDNLLK